MIYNFDAMRITRGDALRVAIELLEQAVQPGCSGIPLLNTCREIIRLGAAAYHNARRSVSFAKAVETTLQERHSRRQRTVSELVHIFTRLAESLPEMRGMPLREVTTELCQEALGKCFRTPRQFAKGRIVLHSLFECGKRHGWCDSNPVAAIPKPGLVEQEITPLSWPEIHRLLAAARQPKHAACMAPLGLMLWAGVRPAELLRLTWEDIDWQEKVINMRPTHTKTGGCRHITLYPALRKWLKSIPDHKRMGGAICPPNWRVKWRALRRDAGFSRWQQDVLRHTFASYHMKQWHDIPKLQADMGHRSPHLLLTRYLSMRGLTTHHVRQFWAWKMTNDESDE